MASSSDVLGSALVDENGELLPPIPLRYIRGMEGDMVEAERRWRETCKWRKGNGIDNILQEPQPHWDAIKANYPHFMHRRCKAGYLAYYEILGDIKIKNLTSEGISIAAVMRQYIFLTEYIWAHLDPREDDGKLFTVMDLEGITMSDLAGDAITFVRQAASIISEHYPERSYKIVIINSPWWFSTIWQIVKPLISVNTQKKVIVERSNYQETLLKYVDADSLPVRFGGNDPTPIFHAPEEAQMREYAAQLMHGPRPPQTEDGELEKPLSSIDAFEERKEDEPPVGQEPAAENAPYSEAEGDDLPREESSSTPSETVDSGDHIKPLQDSDPLLINGDDGSASTSPTPALAVPHENTQSIDQGDQIKPLQDSDSLLISNGGLASTSPTPASAVTHENTQTISQGAENTSPLPAVAEEEKDDRPQVLTSLQSAIENESLSQGSENIFPPPVLAAQEERDDNSQSQVSASPPIAIEHESPSQELDKTTSEATSSPMPVSALSEDPSSIGQDFDEASSLYESEYASAMSNTPEPQMNGSEGPSTLPFTPENEHSSLPQTPL
mmetsp:Transcript_11917/g.15588  ORF Transcript_11917/g.15588 Transcript_11917/m.15588 type:complete len:556 (+) Transcript_11917:107-1774(+)|eukprot:CAMPEP_0117743482 /NCGR_PEP_ID=MMETSP0947-20121206/6166_1 /TAXON_ID=44440 /ORGANISM="Chattonella subsalsa, Strain CCMP2191" /LENGTH=555 /DNA_ID=CAMNT_0005560201 /DNA_START=75 /DNA_END=1742 /DNA_ORIENTATION=+